MKHILVYSDSIAWGIIPMTRNRFPFHQRWPGILEMNLNQLGKDVRVIEDCLNGRRTIYDDPIRPGRNGLIGLSERIEVNSPVELVILMLGTNDFQANYNHTALDAAKGMKRLIHAVRETNLEPGMLIPKILVIAPPPILEPKGDIALKFKDGDKKCMGLAEAYEQLCREEQCDFFDAGKITTSSVVDGVHFDLNQHAIFGQAISEHLTHLI
ncbi:MAG: GDSL family lipase [Candidatus Methylopumilus sp.]|nr:GDSL family lipase [Candidatus Methylopumilus sp.]